MIRSKTNAFPLSTVVIEQYRPPIDAFIIGVYVFTLYDSEPHSNVESELPAGLIDENETPEETAIRELEEETVRSFLAYKTRLVDLVFLGL